MLRKLLIIILGVLGIAITIFNPVVVGVIATVVWIYLVMMIRKKGSSISIDEKGAELAKKRLKASLILSAILFFVSITSIVLHNNLDDHSENHVSIFFYLTLGAMYLFIMTTAGGMFVFLKAQQKI
jgi:hypothetical protein